MRFQPGIGYIGPRRPRGPGRGDPRYRMSQAAYQARLRNLVHWRRPRSRLETQRLRIDIALATLRGERQRATARRLGCSHVYCRKVAIAFRAGRIPFLPADEVSLLAMRDSLGLSENQVDTVLANPARTNIRPALENGVGTCSPGEPPLMTVDERIAETWREVAEWKRKHPIKRPHVVFSVPIR
jgi:hypothetical protein